MTTLRAHPAGPIRGNTALPGDKSVSHRALMLAALAVGESRIEGLLEGTDVLATAGALRRLGVEIARDRGVWRVHGVGVGGLREPDQMLDLGNAGTGARLLLGILAGQPFTTFMTGDASLCSRPMARVSEPLSQMGATFVTRSGVRLPLAVSGSNALMPITYAQPVASAQVKSAILLAGLHAPGRTTVVEPQASRDHTERMLRHLGASVTSQATDSGQAVSIIGQPELVASDLRVPGCISSAAFPLVAGALGSGSSLRVEGVGCNPLRTGLLETLEAMGAKLRRGHVADVGGEPVTRLELQQAPLSGVDVPADRGPSMIDEYPILAVAAASATGTTRMHGLGELRVKESDRLAAMAEGLSACGVAVEADEDSLTVHGCGGPPPGGATIDARHDHRIAMSFLVLGGAAKAAVTVRGAETIETSFPGFASLMNQLGARIERVET
ncbi:MAG: 3-phosphoshikimate 1-carboxyvinyltransferase [Pseudomonadota bacterium]